MRSVLLALATCITFIANGQILVRVNGKPATDKQVFKAEDIKKLEIAFDKTKPIKHIGQGKVLLDLSLNSVDDAGKKLRTEEGYTITTTGENAVADFLSEVKKYYVLYETGVQQKAFTLYYEWFDRENSLQKTLKDVGKIKKNKLELEATLYFQDKIGYEKYGDPFYLANTIAIGIDNSSNHVAASTEIVGKGTPKNNATNEVKAVQEVKQTNEPKITDEVTTKNEDSKNDVKNEVKKKAVKNLKKLF